MGLAFAVALLSYVARSEGKTVIFTMYRRERAGWLGRRRSIADLSDLTVSASMEEGRLSLRCDRGSAWPGRALTLSIP